MKTSLKIFNLFFLAIMLLNFSCKSDDDSTDQEIILPTLTMSNVSYNTTFFSTGQTDAPTVDWNGDVGTFSLAAPIPGFSVDENTGDVSWDRSIFIGNNEVELVATNANGFAAIVITIHNQFMGDFHGAYNNNPNSTTVENGFEMNFNENGTMSVYVVGNGNAGTGTWTHDGPIITSVYSYDGGVNYYTIVVALSHTNTTAQITGYWSSGETLQDPADGYIALDASS
jgi:hypothetical protein